MRQRHSAEQRNIAIDLYLDGLSAERVAKAFGVTAGTITNWVSGDPYCQTRSKGRPYVLAYRNANLVALLGKKGAAREGARVVKEMRETQAKWSKNNGL